MAAVFWLGASALVGVTRPARAEQFVLVDATFDYTWDDATNAKPSKSHFYVNEKNFLNAQRPKDWLAPVDYRNGTLHVRAEVLAKPAGDQQVGWTLCYIANAGDYGCADTPYYKSTGVFERDTKMTDFWQNETIEWGQGIKQIDLIYAINDSGSGHVTNYPELKALTTPTRVRITMVQVSAGATYDPSIISAPGGVGGAAGAGGTAGAGGSAALPSAGGAAGSSAGGYGGLWGGAGAAAAAGSGAGATSLPSAGSPVVGSAGAPLAAAGGASGGSPPVANADVEADSGCSLSRTPRESARFSGILAVFAALGLALRARRLLRR